MVTSDNVYEEEHTLDQTSSYVEYTHTKMSTLLYSLCKPSSGVPVDQKLQSWKPNYQQTLKEYLQNAGMPFSINTRNSKSLQSCSNLRNILSTKNCNLITSFANSVGRMSTAMHSRPSPSMS